MHISKLDKERVEKVEDVVTVGDQLLVKVLEIDSQGRINLSRKDALLDHGSQTPQSRTAITAKRKAAASKFAVAFLFCPPAFAACMRLHPLKRPKSLKAEESAGGFS